MADVEMADALPDLTSLPADPEAQAIITDFLDYTEYFPSDLIRSLTLIGKLDSTYRDTTYQIHDLTKLYGKLPTLPPNDRPNPQTLRKQISAALDYTIRYREAAYAEASRLSDVAERHCARLTTIKRKLQALPEPPSRDPTPAPVSPQATRSRKPDIERTPRITLHVDGARHAAQQKGRSRKITVPGEVLPPPNPDSPVPSTVSDWEESIPASPPDSTDIRVHGMRRQRVGQLKRIKVPKVPKSQKTKVPKAPRVRPPGVMGTNVHSAIAGISTSNALALLPRPPEDAQPGSRYKPWFKLTEYEMALLRKSMKKNAIWTPSDTMIRRQLHMTGRGRENYEKAKALAEATGQPLLDEDPIDPTKTLLAPGEISFQEMGKDELSLSNRGMKLNEAKKLKKETLAREQAARDAMEIEEASRRITDAGNTFKNLFSRSTEDDATAAAGLDSKKKDQPKSNRKRKREGSPNQAINNTKNASAAAAKEQVVQAAPAPKKPKLSKLAPAPPSPAQPAMTTKTTTQVPLAPAGPTSSANRKATPPTTSPTDTKKTPIPVPTTAAAARPRRASVAPKPTTSPEAVPAPAAAASSSSRPGSRSRPVKAASAEPPLKREPRELRELRRGSNVSMPPTTTTTAEARPAAAAVSTGTRSSGRRKPAPGAGAADEDGKMNVVQGKRSAAPKKRVAMKKADVKAEHQAVVEEAWEDIDPDEPRYCLCGDVSWGDMIACENDECENEWFHLPCVGLTEIPPRRAIWYCPECRVKLGVDEKGNPVEELKAIGKRR